MLFFNTVDQKLVEILKTLCSNPAFDSFRLVGGTAIALQLGHRRSIDIDLFSNEKVDKSAIVKALRGIYPRLKAFVAEHNIRASIEGVRLELYDDWHIPFKTPPLELDGMRIATLVDLAAFKLKAITGRREKKDYIDLHFLFEKLGASSVLERFGEYNPNISMKSILFALTEVEEAQRNQSVMPELIQTVDWNDIVHSMTDAAKHYLATRKGKP